MVPVNFVTKSRNRVKVVERLESPNAQPKGWVLRFW